MGWDSLRVISNSLPRASSMGAVLSPQLMPCKGQTKGVYWPSRLSLALVYMVWPPLSNLVNEGGELDHIGKFPPFPSGAWGSAVPGGGEGAVVEDLKEDLLCGPRPPPLGAVDVGHAALVDQDFVWDQGVGVGVGGAVAVAVVGGWW